MADNVAPETISSPSSAINFKTDEESAGPPAVHVPYTKLIEGADGTFNIVGSGNPLPVEVIDVTNTLVADVGTIDTSLTDLPNVIGTDGSAGPSKALSIAGTDGSGNLQEILVSSSGTVAVSGAAADNAAVANAPVLAAGRYDITPATRDDGDVTTLQLNSVGELHVDIENATGVSGSAGPSKALSVAGTDSGGTLRELFTSTSGHVYVVPPQADDAAVAYPSMPICGRYDITPATRQDGDATTFQTNATGSLLIDLGDNNDVTLATLPDTATSDLSTINTNTAALLTTTNFTDVFGTASLVLGTQADNVANTSDGVQTSSFLYGFDGTTWDRLHATAGDLHIHDGGNVISVDWDGTAPPIGAGTEAAALRVTLATDSTGLVSVDDGGSNLSIDLGGTAATLNTGAVDAGTQRVTLATDVALPTGTNTIGAVTINDTSFATSDGNALGEGVLIQGDDGTDRKNINVDAATGDVQVDVTNAITVTGVATAVNQLPATSGGISTVFRDEDIDETAVAAKAGAGQVYWIHCINFDATPVYLHLYDVAQGSVTVGTTPELCSFAVPSQGDANGAGFTMHFNHGIEFGTAITVACTTTIGGTSGPGTNEVILNMGYE